MRVPIHIRYTLKDGRTLCRTFDVLKAQTLEKLLELDQTDCIREERVSGTRQMIRDDAASLVLTDAYFQAPVSLELDFWERAELARCIREDMAAQDIEERYFPESDARMLLLLEAVLEDGLPQGAREIIPLTSAYPRTLAYLEQKGLPVETRKPAVKRIVLHPYDPSTRKAAFGGSVVLLQTKSTMDYNGGYFDRGLTEESPLQVPEDRIEELLPALRSSLYASARCIWRRSCWRRNRGRGRYISGLLRRISPPGFSQTEGGAEEGVLPEAVGARMKPGVFPWTRTGPGEVRRPRMEGEGRS